MGLPSGCVPYLPSAVDTLLRTIDRASVRPERPGESSG